MPVETSPLWDAEAWAHALMTGDEAAAERLAHQCGAEVLAPHRLRGALVPVARALAEWWDDDRCSGTDLLVALGRLQVWVHRITEHAGEPSALQRQSVWVVAAPGEPHALGVALSAACFHAAGWTVGCDFPDSSTALSARLAREWHDVLHLTLSEAFERPHQLGRLAACVRAARRASCNRALLVLVSGRDFDDSPGLATLIGADDAVSHDTDPAALAMALMHIHGVRAEQPAYMVAQAGLDALALHIQRRTVGIPEAGQPPGAPWR